MSLRDELCQEARRTARLVTGRPRDHFIPERDRNQLLKKRGEPELGIYADFSLYLDNKLKGHKNQNGLRKIALDEFEEARQKIEHDLFSVLDVYARIASIDAEWVKTLVREAKEKEIIVDESQTPRLLTTVGQDVFYLYAMKEFKESARIRATNQDNKEIEGKLKIVGRKDIRSLNKRALANALGFSVDEDIDEDDEGPFIFVYKGEPPRWPGPGWGSDK